MKLCIECRYEKNRMCEHPEIIYWTTSPVDGTMTRAGTAINPSNYQTCAGIRASTELCGQDAIRFEPRESAKVDDHA